MTPASGPPFDVPLTGDEVIIGRAEDCHLVVEDRFLSRRHTRLFRSEGRWLAEDLGSRNGTLLNRAPLRQPSPIQPGDQLEMSRTRIVLHEAAAEELAHDLGTEDRRSSSTVYRDAGAIVENYSAVEPAEIADPATLRRLARRLKLLNEVHQALAGPIGLDELLDLILDRTFDHLQPEKGVIILCQGEEGYRLAASRSAGTGASRVADGVGESLGISQTLLQHVIEERQAALIPDVLDDQRFAAAQSMMLAGTRSVLAAPMLDRDAVLGMIALTSRATEPTFREEDLDLLVSLAAVAALRLRNLLLAQRAAEHRLLEEELRLARAIQVGLLPAELPEIPGWQLSGGNLPSRGVSGDLYLVEERRNAEEWVLMVADVSGKGMGAALLGASLEALAAGPIEVGQPPDQICAAVARRLYRRTLPAKYATAIVAALTPATGALRYANAGHNPALLVRASGEVERLHATGQPLGLLPASEYRLGEITLDRGDTLVLYTDGITEASDPMDEEYGLERFEGVLRRGREAPLEELRRAVERDLETFIKGVPPADDRTLVLVRSTGPQHRSPSVKKTKI